MPTLDAQPARDITNFPYRLASKDDITPAARILMVELDHYRRPDEDPQFYGTWITMDVQPIADRFGQPYVFYHADYWCGQCFAPLADVLDPHHRVAFLVKLPPPPAS